MHILPFRLPLLVCVVTVACFIAACDEKLSDLAGPSPNLEPTFTSVQHENLRGGRRRGPRGVHQCHTDVRRPYPKRRPEPPSRMSPIPRWSTSRAAAKAGAIRVIPGDAENSYIVHKLEGLPDIVGERMPRTGGPYLTEGQMTILKRWIATGAKND
jgi:hypothetical protein